MKKSAVFTIVACSITVIILVGVLVVGLTSDGFGIGNLWRDTDSGEPANKYEYTWDPSETDVTGLDIEWINGPVEIKTGPDKVIKIMEKTNWELSEKDKLQLSSSGGTLKIKWNDEFISFGIFHNKKKQLVIEVPAELAKQMEELKCSNTSGLITAAGFTAENIHLSSTSGSLELSSLNAQRIDISTTSGSVIMDQAKGDEIGVGTTSGKLDLTGIDTLEGSFTSVSGSVNLEGKVDDLSADSVSGSVYADLSNCPAELDMESVSGSLDLTIPENPGFEAEYSSVSGTFTSDFPVSGDTGKSGRVQYGSGAAKFEFTTTSGSMRVLKK